MSEQNYAPSAFKDHGYVLLKGAISKDSLHDLTRNLWEVVLPRGCQRDTIEDDILRLEGESHEQVYRASITLGSSFAAYSLIFKANLRGIARELLQCAETQLHVTPLMTAIQIPGKTEYDYEWHQESSFYPWAPALLNFWFPVLAPTKRGTGTISLIPGSHKLGRRPESRSGEGKFIQIKPLVTGREESTALEIEAEPGDLLVFHADMIHKSIANVSGVPRVTGIVRVIDQGAMEKPRPLYKSLSYVN